MLTRSTARDVELTAGASGEYSVVPLRMSWGIVAILLFFASFFARPFFYLVPFHPRDPATWWVVRAFSPLFVALAGLACGLIGLRYSPSKLTAKVGVFLNGTVAVLVTLIIVAFVIYRHWGR